METQRQVFSMFLKFSHLIPHCLSSHPVQLEQFLLVSPQTFHQAYHLIIVLENESVQADLEEHL